MKFEINVDEDIFYKLMIAELDDSIESLEDDLTGYANGVNANVFFWGEPKKDIKQIKKRIKALRVTRDWYSVPV